MKFTVVYGEKTSVFEIQKTKSGAELNFSNSDGKKIKRELSQDDFAKGIMYALNRLKKNIWPV